jgi:hypothetical protein
MMQRAVQQRGNQKSLVMSEFWLKQREGDERI